MPPIKAQNSTVIATSRDICKSILRWPFACFSIACTLAKATQPQAWHCNKDLPFSAAHAWQTQL
ncbi:hypothetical protein ACO0LD_12640 [Undibacterium sp. Ji83W]|uniref:hypothetical protein n=1 Tax=Undibacterium sp. Ji83W TaxID=3413043 RepID=UPI003BF05E4F